MVIHCPRVVQERLDYELDCIISNGYGVLYYIAHASKNHLMMVSL